MTTYVINSPTPIFYSRARTPELRGDIWGIIMWGRDMWNCYAHSFKLWFSAIIFHIFIRLKVIFNWVSRRANIWAHTFAKWPLFNNVHGSFDLDNDPLSVVSVIRLKAGL